MGFSFSKPIMVAIFDYEPINSEQVKLTKGDRLVIISRQNRDWYKVKLIETGTVGLAPSNYFALENSIEAEDYYFENLSRKESQDLLFSGGFRNGKYLVRRSEQHLNPYTLSVTQLLHENNKISYHVKNYKIKQHNNKFSLEDNRPFNSIKELIQYYKRTPLSHQGKLKLTKPCPKSKPLVFYEWEIKRKDIKVLQELGHGNFGTVHSGMWYNTKVAIKCLKEGSMSKEDFLKEAEIMKQIRHPKLVSLYGVCTSEEPIWIVQELLNGCLLDYLRDRKGKWEIENLTHFAYQVADGMSYLEKNKYIHRDLAARNVLVGQLNICKICDFGLARNLDYNNYVPRTNSEFPVKWTAPEAMCYDSYSTKSDVWSYGVLLIEIFTHGQIPYPGLSNEAVRKLIIDNDQRMTRPKVPGIPDNIYEVIQICWLKEPIDRPTFASLKEFFENIDIKSYDNVPEQTNVLPESPKKYKHNKSSKRRK